MLFHKILVLAFVLALTIFASAETIQSSFEDPLSHGWDLVGETEIVSGEVHSGQYSLKIGTRGRAILLVSENNVYGTVSFWVKDSMANTTAAEPRDGPRFGLINKDGEALLIGVFRKSYLSKQNYNYIQTAQNNYYDQYNTAVPRKSGWQKWTIEATGSGVLNVYQNDTLNANISFKEFFSKGFTGVYFIGGDAGDLESFQFDDITVEIGDQGQIDTHAFPLPRVLGNVLNDPNFFPIAVWAQPTDYIDYYKDKGVNVFVGEGAKSGVTAKQFLDALQAKGIYGIVHFTQGTDHVYNLNTAQIQEAKNHPALLAWMFGDEPDNSPSANPLNLKQNYDGLYALDSTKPVYLNLGSGVGNPARRQAKTTDYYGYCEATDIISYDIYPVSTYEEGEKHLYFVAQGIDNLKKWSNNKKPIWIWLEASRIGHTNRPPTAAEVRAEVWMSIIHGADGIGWFPHVFDPYAWKDIPADVEQEMKSIGQTLTSLAPALKSQELPTEVTAEMLVQGRVDVSSRIYNGKLYFFAVNMNMKPTSAKFKLPSSRANAQFSVINEERTAQASNGYITEQFAPYEVHLYEETATKYYYVRAGTSGNGGSWSNALPELPANMQRGYTYYIADGDYPIYAFDDTPASEYITIKKATIADHGTNDGWQNSYGDGQATLGDISFANTSNIILDGSVADGFKIKKQGYKGVVVSINKSDNITVQNCDIDGQFATLVNDNATSHTSGACHGGQIIESSNITIKNCKIHNAADDGFEIVSNKNVYLIGNEIYDLYGCGTDGGCGPCYNGHSDGLELQNTENVEIEGNIIYDVRSTSAIITGQWYPDWYTTNLTIKNNIFYTPETGITLYIYYVHGAKIYNNVIWGRTQGPRYGGLAIGKDVTGLELYNNIILNINYNHLQSAYDPANHKINYNLFGMIASSEYTANSNDLIGNPLFKNMPLSDNLANHFREVTIENFELQQSSPAIDKGMNTGLTTDIAGNPRPAGAGYDIGAFEFQGPTICGTQTCPTGQICCSNTCKAPACTATTGCNTGQQCTNPGQCNAACQNTQCSNGTITSTCYCQNSVRTTGYCCNNIYQTTACEQCTADSQCNAGQKCCLNTCKTPSCIVDANCNDSNAATKDTCTIPSSCTAACAHTAITQCINNDGYCAPGCRSTNDNDCLASCGNGAIDANENCSNCPQDIKCSTGKLCCNATCITLECTTDSNCSTGKKCINAGTCTATCTDCNITCTTNTQCNDNNTSTTDSCQNPATCDAYCKNEPALCGTQTCTTSQICCNNNCTTPTCTTSTQCNDNDKCITDKCNKAGSCEATCTHTQIPKCGWQNMKWTLPSCIPINDLFTVTIKDETGQPLEGVTIEYGTQKILTDEKGQSTLLGEKAQYFITATKDGYNSLNGKKIATTTCNPTYGTTNGTKTTTGKEKINIQIQGTPYIGKNFTIQITDNNKQPLQGATVQYGNQTATTDETGQATLQGEKAKYLITATATQGKTTTKILPKTYTETGDQNTSNGGTTTQQPFTIPLDIIALIAIIVAGSIVLLRARNQRKKQNKP